MDGRIIDLRKVEDVIERYDLKNKNRSRRFIWNRYAFYKFMRDNGFTLYSIGNMVDKDHATVLNGINIYNQNKRYADFQGSVMDIEVDLAYTIVQHVEQTDDICLNEMICLANLETLISNRL